MSEIAVGTLFAAGLFVGMVVLLELGRRLRQRHRSRHGEGVGEGVGAIEGAVFGLMGLLLAFTFSGAASRFDARRELVIEESNAIGSAYQRLDLLPPEPRQVQQELLRRYVDARLSLYRAIPHSARVRAAYAQAAALQGEIWSRAVTAVRDAPLPQLAGLLLPALNQMFDLSTTRLASTRIHPPAIIYGLLGVVSLLCALPGGIRHGGERVAKLGAYSRPRGHPRGHHLRDRGSRVPSARLLPDLGLRSAAGRGPGRHALTDATRRVRGYSALRWRR
ncbi:MAG TPA: hypothetical protein VHR41_04990 [Gemmatimonadales bacterium]|nr:hypothetical protein [Gemmatimonadales bacterium]